MAVDEYTENRLAANTWRLKPPPDVLYAKTKNHKLRLHNKELSTLLMIRSAFNSFLFVSIARAEDRKKKEKRKKAAGGLSFSLFRKRKTKAQINNLFAKVIYCL